MLPRGRAACRTTATLSFTVLDPMKLPVPGWHKSCKSSGLNASGRCRAAFRAGRNWDIRWKNRRRLHGTLPRARRPMAYPRSRAIEIEQGTRSFEIPLRPLSKMQPGATKHRRRARVQRRGPQQAWCWLAGVERRQARHNGSPDPFPRRTTCAEGEGLGRLEQNATSALP